MTPIVPTAAIRSFHMLASALGSIPISPGNAVPAMLIPATRCSGITLLLWERRSFPFPPPGPSSPEPKRRRQRAVIYTKPGCLDPEASYSNPTFREIASVDGLLKVSLQWKAMEVQGNPAEPSFTRIHSSGTWPNFFSVGMIPNLTICALPCGTIHKKER
jgi:hypothetical protein